MSHGHRKYYEREDGYVYTPEELDAYRVPVSKRNRCVNFYVPFATCRKIKNPNDMFKTLAQVVDHAFDQWGGECHKEQEAYLECYNQYVKNALASPVRNAYYYAALAAKAEGISPEFQKNLGSSPFLY